MKNKLLTPLTVLLLMTAFHAAAQNKVVVIPLGDNGVQAPKTESGNNNDQWFNASRAYEIIESTEITGNISSEEDVDYYEVYLPSCYLLTAEIVAAGGDNCGAFGAPTPYIDTFLTMYEPDGTDIINSNEDINSSNNYCSRVQGLSTGEDFYYIRVESSPTLCPACTFNYKLVLSTQPSLC